MKTRKPTKKEIEELVSFIPRLSAKGFKPIKKWLGGTVEENDVYTWPSPLYDEVVDELIQVLSKECWVDYNYDPGQASQMVMNKELIRKANIDQIKTMLTFCVRGERFCDGHFGEMIEKGIILRLLQRVAELKEQI